MFFNKYPYTDFHELNLSWVIATLTELDEEIKKFVSLNAIKYADPIQWDITRQYETNTVVIDPITGTAYISVQPVPSGVALTNTDYWTVVFDLGSFVTRSAKNFTSRYEESTTLTATFPSSVGDWLVWGDILYKVISPIVAGDQYVVDSNIEHFTMENIINTIFSQIGDLNDLLTTDKSSIVNAINELDINIGQLDDLDTTDKSSIVNAINENVNKLILLGVFVTPQMYGAVGDGVTDDTNAFISAIASGKPVVVPESEYLITQTLDLPLKTSIYGINHPALLASGKVFNCDGVGYFLTLDCIDIHIVSNTSANIIELTDTKACTMNDVRIGNYTGLDNSDVLYTSLLVDDAANFSGYLNLNRCAFSGKVGVNLKCSTASMVNCALQTCITAVIDSCESLNIIDCTFYNFTGETTYVINNNYVHYLLNCYFEPYAETNLSVSVESGKHGRVYILGGKNNFSYPSLLSNEENSTFYGDTMRGVSGQNLLIDNWGIAGGKSAVETDHGTAWRCTSPLSVYDAVYLHAGQEYTLSAVYTLENSGYNGVVQLLGGGETFSATLNRLVGSTLSRTAKSFTPTTSGFFRLFAGPNAGSGYTLDFYSISVCKGVNFAESTYGKVCAPDLLSVKGSDGNFYDIGFNGYLPTFTLHGNNNTPIKMVLSDTMTATTDSMGKIEMNTKKLPDYVILAVKAGANYASVKYFDTIPYIFIENGSLQPVTGTSVTFTYYYMKIS